MVELRPCPFCGRRPEQPDATCIEPGWWASSLSCDHDYATVQMVARGETADEARERVIADWNRRVWWLS